MEIQVATVAERQTGNSTNVGERRYGMPVRDKRCFPVAFDKARSQLVVLYLQHVNIVS